ncbi:alpha/beta hydrolase [Longimicrobium sp.]|uniref:alpha/beta hydrolase n=1 Tax=Longimicrobium sp. TaxID=2029185 RepID=UPI002E33662A|nr:alpha/beta fold hydrolase [Longimicrobium sp.]HEX6041941.1 alpha/beta fold hydrolase [Longimicrobium sp.]
MKAPPAYGARLAAWARRLGVRAADVRYPRPAARGEACAVRLLPPGPPRARVLVAHGAGNDAVFPLLELFRALLRAQCEVFSFDVDGHGCGSTTVFAPDSVRTALAAAADVAERGGPALPLHLVGHSLGGSLLLDALADGSLDRAASAVVLSAPVDLRLGARTVLGELGGFFSRAVLAQREHYGWWGLVPAFGPVKRAAYPFRRTDGDGRAWSYVSAVQALLGEMRLDDRVGSITVPTLLIYSRADWLVPHTEGERLAARMPAARLLSLAGATHYSVPFAPEAVDATVRWMDAHPATAEAA